MLDVRRLRLLVELDRRGTIAAVATALSYSPSAVSQQLSVLETEAGVPLTEAAGRRLRLTAEGALLVRHAQGILASVERAETALASARHEVSGTVHLAAFQSAALTLVPKALVHCAGQYAQLRVDLTVIEPEAALPALVTGEFDLVLAEEYPGYPRPLLPGLTVEELIGDPLRLAIPHTWRTRSLSRLAGRPFVMEPPGTTAREWSDSVCRRAGFEPDVRYVTTDLQVHARLVSDGLAAGFLPRLAMGGDTMSFRAVRVEGDPVRRIFTARRSAAAARPAIHAVGLALAHAAR